MKLGAQLYTVRDFTKNLTDFSETLKKIAEIGYSSVQVSGTCAFHPDWLADQLKQNGLICPVTHTSLDRLTKEPERVAAEHLIFGCDVIGLGSFPGAFSKGMDDYAAFYEQFAPVAKALKKSGTILGFHNHHFEFQKFDGKTLIERMSEDFSADELTFILDTYWVQYSGGNPAAWLKKLSGRVSRIHLKDMAIVGDKQRMAVVGEGNIDWDDVLSACVNAGTQYVFVEQDDCYGENPLECLRRSYQNLKTMGLS